MADEINPTPGAEDSQDQSWDDVLGDYAKERGIEVEKPETTTDTTTQAPEEGKEDEQPETTTTTTTEAPEAPETTTTTTTVDPNETPEQKTEREKRESDEAAKRAAEEEKTPPSESAITARRDAREYTKQVEAVAADIQKEMFADAPETMIDGDGKPITSVEDVMKLNNPNTSEPFTYEEASLWFLHNQQEFNKQLDGRKAEINRIAETQVDSKDQADSIMFNYGELFKAMPELKEKIWTKFEKTLVRDPKTNIITKMPIGLQEYYEDALAPYVETSERLTAAEKEEADRKAAADKAEADRKKKTDRLDRSDIFGRGNVDEPGNDEEKGWGKAMDEYYKNR